MAAMTTVRVHEAALVTRNTKDFNPEWERIALHQVLQDGTDSYIYAPSTLPSVAGQASGRCEYNVAPRRALGICDPRALRPTEKCDLKKKAKSCIV